MRRAPLTGAISVQADCVDLREKLEEAKKQQHSQEDMIRWLNKQVCWHHCSMLINPCRHLWVPTMTAICQVCQCMILQGALCGILRVQGCLCDLALRSQAARSAVMPHDAGERASAARILQAQDAGLQW